MDRFAAPKFGVSFSRLDSALGEDGCLRWYFWRSYGSWKGWERDAPPDAALAYRLGKMRSLAALAGAAVHEAAQHVFGNTSQGLSVWPADKLAQETANAFMGDVRRILPQDLHSSSKRKPALQEAVYGVWDQDPRSEDFDRTTAKRLKPGTDGFRQALNREVVFYEERIRVSVQVLTELPLLKHLASGAYRLERMEQLTEIQVPFEGSEDTFTAWISPDMLLSRPDVGRYLLVDWKSGEAKEGHIEQLGLYAMEAVQAGIPPSDVGLMLVYLSEESELRRVQVYPCRQQLVDEARARLQAGAGQLRELAVDGDVVANRPVEMERFTQLAEGSSRCGWCEYRMLCGRD